jgi:AcrR family transcriptional regulator
VSRQRPGHGPTLWAVSTPEPLIRPPLQRRSQESLERVLTAGFEVLKEDGFEGFTLQAVSKRAGVSIGSIYARVPSREALIMAIYERVMAWTEEDQISPRSARESLPPRERVEMLVRELAGQMLTHGADLRVFMRQAAVNPEIWERGSEKSQATADVFRHALLEHPEDIGHPDPELAIDVAFRMMYCTIARRITHGPRFESGRELSDDALVTELARAIADYLL